MDDSKVLALNMFVCICFTCCKLINIVISITVGLDSKSSLSDQVREEAARVELTIAENHVIPKIASKGTFCILCQLVKPSYLCFQS